MHLRTLEPQAHLGADHVVDRFDDRLVALAAELREVAADDVDHARRAFELSRDEVLHSWDAQDRTVTVNASDVLEEKVGLRFGRRTTWSCCAPAACRPSRPGGWSWPGSGVSPDRCPRRACDRMPDVRMGGPTG